MQFCGTVVQSSDFAARNSHFRWLGFKHIGVLHLNSMALLVFFLKDLTSIWSSLLCDSKTLVKTGTSPHLQWKFDCYVMIQNGRIVTDDSSETH